MREALDIIVKLWSINEPFTNADGYWIVKNEEAMCGSRKPHIKPLMFRARMGIHALPTERHGIPVVVLLFREERLDALRGDQANVVPVWLNLRCDASQCAAASLGTSLLRGAAISLIRSGLNWALTV